MLYTCVVCVLYFSCCIFSKEKTRFITGKRKVEEQCESAQKNILILTASHYALILYNGILTYELTSTMYNIYTTQKTTTKLTSDKKEPKKKLQKTSEEKQIGFEPEFN